MRTLTFLLLLFSAQVVAQQNIAQFVTWKPKTGEAQQFEKGYQQHLIWHKTNRDPWGWYGWFIISGPRQGQFIDATIDHAWRDFDHPVKPAEDRADNNLRVFPYGELQTVIKASCLKALSIGNSNGLKSKFLRMVTLHVTDINNGIKLVEQLKLTYQTNTPLKNLQVYKIIDGGNINQLILFFGFNSYEEYGTSEELQETLGTIETALKVKTIKAITSETLVYREDMSLFPD